MGTGKSSAFREFMGRILAPVEPQRKIQKQDDGSTSFWEPVATTGPAARVLLLGANILYSSNLAAELKAAFPDVKVGFYKELEDGELAGCQVVVCSLESLHRIGDQRF